MQTERVALITGSSKGLGKKTALELAKAGFNIVINYLHSENEAIELQQQIRQFGREAISVRADITSPDQVEHLINRGIDHFGRIDVLVNNAGPFIRKRKKLVDHSLDEVRQMLNGNLLGPIWTTRLVLPYMRQQQWGRVIFFGFGRAGEAPAWPDRSAYAAAKVGLASLTKSLAIEEAPYGITVNMICPGDIRDGHKEKDIIDVRNLIDTESPRIRPGAGEDISRVIRFLCDESSDFITATLVGVTGGLDVIKPRP
jgi:3-oxoacyl-[acyl-carrier protein] reductase